MRNRRRYGLGDPDAPDLTEEEYEELQGYYDTCQADRFDIYFDR